MQVDTAKYLSMVLLGGVSLLLGFLPYKIGTYFIHDDKKWKRTLTSVLLCFGGGVLFATSFVHILPEVRENIEASEIDLEKLPNLAEILLCAGFFLIYFIEESVHYFLDSDVHHHHKESMQVHRSFSIQSQNCEAGITEKNWKRTRTISYPSSILPDEKAKNWTRTSTSSDNSEFANFKELSRVILPRFFDLLTN